MKASLKSYLLYDHRYHRLVVVNYIIPFLIIIHLSFFVPSEISPPSKKRSFHNLSDSYLKESYISYNINNKIMKKIIFLAFLIVILSAEDNLRTIDNV